MSGRGLFSKAKIVQSSVFYITHSKGRRRFYYFLPLLGGGREGVWENLMRPHLNPPLRGEENL
jgi:hypothetical protein